MAALSMLYLENEAHHRMLSQNEMFIKNIKPIIWFGYSVFMATVGVILKSRQPVIKR